MTEGAGDDQDGIYEALDVEWELALDAFNSCVDILEQLDRTEDDPHDAFRAVIAAREVLGAAEDALHLIVSPQGGTG